MAGTIKRMIDAIVQQRTMGDPSLARMVHLRLLLKGIDTSKYTEESPDDPLIIQKLSQISHEFNVSRPQQDVPHQKTAFSTLPTVAAAVADLKKQFEDFPATFVLYFASSSYDPAEISLEMQGAFAGSEVMGCSSAGEFVSGQLLRNSIVAMAFDAKAASKVALGVIERLNDEADIKRAFVELEAKIGVPAYDWNFRKYLGLILIDGLCASHDFVMDRIGTLTDVVFVGGAASDNRNFDATYVYANGKAYPNAAIVALLKPETPFSFIKIQSVKPLGKILVPTKVNVNAREILELNHCPACEAYAEAIGVTPEEAASLVSNYPLGLMFGDEPYLRGVLYIEGNSLFTAGSVLEGMDYQLMTRSEIIANTKQILADTVAKKGPISGIVGFICSSRLADITGEESVKKQYAQIYHGYPMVGFGTYGEEYFGHLNQTSVLLAFH